MPDMVTLCYQVLEILLGSTDYSTWRTFGPSAASLRRRRLRRVAVPNSQALSLLGRDLREAYLQVLLGSGGYRSENANVTNAATGPFLSSLILNFPASGADEISKSVVTTAEDTPAKKVAPSHIWKSSTLLQFLKNANQIPGLTSRCFILQLKLEVALIILSQLHGNLCFSAVSRNWNHNSHPLDFPFMDKRLLFLQYILQDLAVLVLLLLLREITQTMQILFVLCRGHHWGIFLFYVNSIFSAAFYNQITQTMQIPLSYAEDIIGVEGRSIEFIRRSSGALLTVQESRGLPDEITVEIKGTSSQVQAAQQLIQEVIATSNKDQIPSSYGRMDTGLRSSYSQLDSISYPSSSVSSLPYDAYGNSIPSQQPYGSSGLGGGYSTFRL